MCSILVIEPHPELRRFVATILIRAGHEVRDTADVAAAAALLRAEAADVLVTDLPTGEREGADAFDAMRCEFRGIDVIAISSAPHTLGYLRLAATLGGPRTLAHPFISRDLMTLLNDDAAGPAAGRATVDVRSERMTSSDCN